MLKQDTKRILFITVLLAVDKENLINMQLYKMLENKIINCMLVLKKVSNFAVQSFPLKDSYKNKFSLDYVCLCRLLFVAG